MSKTIIKADAEALLLDLAKALLVVPKNSPMPILENFLLDFRKGKSYVIATNLAQHFRSRIEASSDEEISFAVPAQLFTELIGNIRGAITMDVQKNKIVIKTNAGQYSLSILSPEDYPEFPKIKKSEAIVYENITKEVLLDTLNDVEYAMDKNDIRPAMCGIFVEPSKVQPKMVTTNGVVLSIRNLTAEIGEGEGFIIPQEAIPMIKKILPDKFNMIKSDGKIFFSDDNAEFSTRLINEKYPKYQSVIPLENDKEVFVNRQEFISSVKRLKLFKDRPETGMIIKISPDGVMLKINNALTGSNGEERLESKHNLTEDFVIGVWPDNMLNSLSAFDCEEIKMTFSLPTKAILITDPADESNISLVMPRKMDEEI